MTPHELNLHIEAYVERKKQENESDLATAWLTAYYNRVKRMPDLKTILESIRPKPGQTDEEMAAQMAMFAAQMNSGGE